MRKLVFYNPKYNLDSSYEYRNGPETWTVNTVKHLVDNNIDISIVNQVPYNSIVVTHNDYVGQLLMKTNSNYIVSIQADRHIDSNSNAVIVQNKSQYWQKIFFHKVYFAKHWPERNILKRIPEKGRFHLSYFGRTQNIDKYFLSDDWLSFISEKGFKWSINSNKDNWNDFREIDLLIAIRSFDNKSYRSKPPTKLFNSWLAEVPIITNDESAYKFHGNKSKNYFAVKTIEQLKSQILFLYNNQSYYENIIRNIKSRSEEVSIGKISMEWQDILNSIKRDVINYEKSMIAKMVFKIKLLLRKVFLFLRK
jgi:hypothetical protein